MDIKRAPEAAISGAGETARRATISSYSLHNLTASRKRDPGTYGLAHEIANTPTNELREQVHLQRAYGDMFGMAGERRRRLVIVELGRRMAMPR